MPRRKTVEVYKISELKDEARERSFAAMLEAGFGDVEPEWLTEMFKQRLEELGLPGDDVRWSLGYSQGDGVAFYGPIDLEEYIGRNKLSKFEPVLEWSGDVIDIGSARIEGRSSHYHHWNTMDVQIEADLSGGVPSGRKRWHPHGHVLRLVNELEEHIQEHVKKVSRELEKMGYAELEYRRSEEALVEDAEANELVFTADGELA